MSIEKIYNIKVILVEPSGPINIGSVARLCYNFKVDELRIVSPRCDIFSLEAKKMALRGIKYLNKSTIFKSLDDAISDCDLALASCGRINYSKNSNHETIENISEWLKNFKEIKNLALIFGREDSGLTNQELLKAQKVFTIGTSKEFPSLNLSHAVSIVLYEFQKSPKDMNFSTKRVLDLANPKQIDDSFKEIEKLLLDIGYLLPHNSSAKISKFKKYIIKTEISSYEINIIRGIVHQINWALKNQEKL